MSRPAVYFESVEVRRARGIGQGVVGGGGAGFALAGLSPGVNLVHGPNGVGKSTVALCLQELLWPGKCNAGRVTAAGRLRNGSACWHLSLEAGHYDRLADMPDVGPAELRHRYHLALHDLITDDASNAPFAKKIADESQGGYDLAAAAEKLGFQPKPSRPSGLINALRSAHAAVEQARRAEAAVFDKNDSLPGLRHEHAAAAAAERQATLRRQALACHAAEARCRQLAEELAALPPQVARLTGQERDQLNGLEARRQTLESRRTRADARAAAARQKLAELNLPEAGVDGNALDQLAAEGRRLAEVERELRQARTQLAEAKAKAQAAADRLAPHVCEAQLAELGRVALPGVSAFARKAERLRGQEAALAGQRQWLDHAEPAAETADTTTADTDLRTLYQGLGALGSWLATPAPAAAGRRNTTPTFAAAAVLGLLALVLAFTVHLAWLALLLPAGALVAWELWLARPASAVGDERIAHRRAYEAAALPSPPAWDVTGVVGQLARLQAQAEARQQADRLAERRRVVELEAADLAARRADLDAERTALFATWGIDPAIEDEWLVVLAENLAGWQSQQAVAAGAAAKALAMQHETDQLLRDVCDRLAVFGLAAVSSGEAATAAIDALRRVAGEHADARRELTETAREVHDTIEPELAKLQAERRRLFERLGVLPEDDETLDDWLALLPKHRDVTQNLEQARGVVTDRKRELAGHEDLLTLPPETLQAEVAQAEALSARRDELAQQIYGIEAEIAAAKQGHGLSDALREKAVAKADLAADRRRQAEAVVGHVLADWVRTAAVEANRPAVFAAANRLLVQLTQGTLQLAMDEASPVPRFTARKGLAAPQPVEQLSVGERVQLLLAVRLAFLEQDEHVRLPLLLDETLGTSDDGRSGLIIDTIIEAARQGRQVFYFTAQHDEVGKWLHRLQNAGVPYEVIDLAQARGLSAAAQQPLQISEVPAATPPPPEPGMTHADYGRLLNVPGLDPAEGPADQAHVWHIIDDPHAVHALLSRRIEVAHQLQTLLAHDATSVLGQHAAACRHVPLAVDVLGRAFELWRRGRGTPVDRQVLEASCAVTPTFMDRLAALAASLEGDAARLLAALEAGEVAHWRQSNTTALQTYFEAHGHLAAEPRLSPADIRTQLLATYADAFAQQTLSQAWLDRVVASLPD